MFLEEGEKVVPKIFLFFFSFLEGVSAPTGINLAISLAWARPTQNRFFCRCWLVGWLPLPLPSKENK